MACIDSDDQTIHIVKVHVCMEYYDYYGALWRTTANMSLSCFIILTMVIQAT